ncbi:MAG: hypothetical protein CME32_11015, partial [Gimesia sp.]|nr:hypothetical protein [Gimesia sp.]
MKMNQKTSPLTQPIPYKILFPWLHLFRTFRLAVDFQKILLAVAGLLMLSLGNYLFNKLPFAPEAPASTGVIAVQHTIQFPPPSAGVVSESLTSERLSGLSTTPSGELLSPATLLEPMG